MNEVLKIHDYHGNNYLVNLEEKLDDILWMLHYEDHGDTFYIVYTKDDKIFAYGWWNDRYHFGSYIRDHKLFAKKASGYEDPFKKKSSGISLTWDIRYTIEHYLDDHDVSDWFYQERFNKIIENLIQAYDTGYMYNWTKYKADISKFLVNHQLDTEKNLEALENAPWTSIQINGCIGIAAKEDQTNRAGIRCDSLLSVWDEGSWHDTRYDDDDDCWEPEPHFYRNIPYGITDPDDWGMCSYIFSIQNIKNCLSQKVLF